MYLAMVVVVSGKLVYLMQYQVSLCNLCNKRSPYVSRDPRGYWYGRRCYTLSIMNIVLKFLHSISVIHQQQHVSSDITVHTCSCSGLLGNIEYMTVILLHDMSSELGTYIPQDKYATLLVVRNNEFLEELLICSSTSILDLMGNNILLVHMLSVVAAMNVCHGYGLLHMRSTGDDDSDRREVLLAYSNPDTIYESVPPHVTVSMHKPTTVYYSRFRNPLEQFGPNYIYVVFRASAALGAKVANTIYVARSHNSILVSKLSDAVRETTTGSISSQ